MDRPKWKERSWNWRWGIPFVVLCILVGALLSWGFDQAFGDIP